MVSHDTPIPREGKLKKQNKKPKSDQANTAPSEDGRSYGIDRLNLGELANNLESDSKLILAQRWEVQMANKVL